MKAGERSVGLAEDLGRRRVAGRIGPTWLETALPGWIPEDVNRDGVVNTLDVAAIGVHWGERVWRSSTPVGRYVTMGAGQKPRRAPRIVPRRPG
jgi:hypothetical protein